MVCVGLLHHGVLFLSFKVLSEMMKQHILPEHLVAWSGFQAYITVVWQGFVALVPTAHYLLAVFFTYVTAAGCPGGW